MSVTAPDDTNQRLETRHVPSSSASSRFNFPGICSPIVSKSWIPHIPINIANYQSELAVKADQTDTDLVQ